MVPSRLTRVGPDRTRRPSPTGPKDSVHPQRVDSGRWAKVKKVKRVSRAATLTRYNYCTTGQTSFNVQMSSRDHGFHVRSITSAGPAFKMPRYGVRSFSCYLALPPAHRWPRRRLVSEALRRRCRCVARRGSPAPPREPSSTHPEASPRGRPVASRREDRGCAGTGVLGRRSTA